MSESMFETLAGLEEAARFASDAGRERVAAWRAFLDGFVTASLDADEPSEEALEAIELDEMLDAADVALADDAFLDAVQILRDVELRLHTLAAPV